MHALGDVVCLGISLVEIGLDWKAPRCSWRIADPGSAVYRLPAELDMDPLATVDSRKRLHQNKNPWPSHHESFKNQGSKFTCTTVQDFDLKLYELAA